MTQNKIITIRSTLLLIIIFLLLNGFAFSKDDVTFIQMDKSSGLSDNTVVSIIQDSRGFMWLGTGAGLNYYDGNKFKLLRAEEGNRNSLTNNYVSAIVEDSSGNLWIGTNSGLNKLSVKTGEITQFLHDPDDQNTISNNFIRSLLFDSKGRLWVGSRDGVSILDSEGQTFKHYKENVDDPNALRGYSVYSMLEDSHGTIWLGTRYNTLHKFNEAEGNFTRYEVPRKFRNRLTPGSRPSGFEIFEDSKGNLWISNSSYGLYGFNRNSGEFTPFNLELNELLNRNRRLVTAIEEDNDGDLWLSTTGGGVIRVDVKNNEFRIYGFNPNLANSLRASYVHTLYKDTSGLLWVGTLNGGITKIRKTLFPFLAHNPDNEFNLSSMEIRTILQDGDGTLWVGMRGGLDRIDSVTRKRKTYHTLNNDEGPIELRTVYWLFEEDENHLLIAGTPFGVIRFDKRSETYEFVLDHYRVKHVVRDRVGNIWAAASFGSLYKINALTGQTLQITPNIIKDFDPDKRSVEIVSVTPDNHLWVGTDDGLYDINLSTEEARLHSKITIDGIEKSISEIQAFCVTRDGNFWIGTADGYVLKYNPEGGGFDCYDFLEPTPYKEIKGILEDDNGFLWLSTNSGIYKFDPGTGKHFHFNESHGLQGADFISNSVFKDKAGRLYFGWMGGINIIDTSEVNPSEFDPPILITSFISKEETISPFRGIDQEEIFLVDYKDRDITIEFSNQDYSATADKEFMYILNGFDEQWRVIEDTNSVSYTNLPARSYTFKVKGRDRSGVWSEKEASIRFMVLQPFWQSWGFRGLMALFVIGIISGVVYLQLRSTEKQRVKLERIVEERTSDLEKARESLQTELHQRKKAEQVLLEERGVFIGGPVTVFRLGKKPSAPAEYVSENVRQFGFGPEEFTSGRISVADLIHPDDYKRVMKTIISAAHSGKTAIEIEFRIINASGRIRWIHQFTTINREPSGKVKNFIGYDLDITDRKIVEQNLTEERNIFIGGPVKVLKIGPDLTKPAEYLSPNVAEYGYSPEDWTSGSISVKKLINPKDYKRVVKEYIQATRAGENSFDSEFRIQTKDGTERWVYQFMVIIRDDSGKVASYLGYYLDITERKLAEQALLEERNLFIGGPVVVFKAKMNIIKPADYVSSNITQFGYSVEDWLDGRVGLKDIIHPDDFKVVLRKIVTETARGKSAFDIEFRAVKPDGEIRWVYQFVVIARDENGKPHNYYGYVLDITENKHAQLAVRESEEKYRNLVETAQDSILILEPKTEKIIYANPVAEEMYGYSIAELQNMSLKDLTEDVETGEREINEILRDGSSKNFESIHRCKNGDLIFVLLSGSVIQYAGKMSLFAIIRDITDRKKAEEELRLAHNALENRVEERTEELVKINERLMGEIAERIRTQQALQESEERFRSLFENATIGIYRTKPSGEILLANPALVRMLGYSTLSELVERNLEEEGFHPEYSRKDFIKQLEKGEEIRGLEAAWKRNDGTLIHVRESARPIRDANENILFIEGTVEDITDMKIAEEQAKERQKQLMQADKMVSLGTLISGIAHEINNPNLFINSNSTVLVKMWDSTLPILENYYKENGDFRFGGTKYSKARDAIPEMLSGIREGSDRIRNIVSELRDFAGEGRAEMSETVDINAVLKSATTIVFNLIKNSSNKFTVAYEKDLPYLTGNYQRLEQVLINLLTNACHALPNKDCAIEISTLYDKKARKIIVKVRDEGVGIPQDKLDRITEPFFTTKSKSGGTGLGLSISNTIIKEHGGKLYHESESDKGTTAFLVLPLNHKKN